MAKLLTKLQPNIFDEVRYPDPIPVNVSVPSWAYLDVTETNDAFDPAAAYNVSVGSHSSKTNAGAIAGGVIGCIFGGALIFALLFRLYKKRRASRPDFGTSPQTSENQITDPPPSIGLAAGLSLLLSTNAPAVPLPPPWAGTPAIPLLPLLTRSPTPVQKVYEDALQKSYDPDGDIPTSSTCPQPRNEGPRGLLPITEHHWGQVGQYYADIPEL
ncbi:hypothetical protein F5887DRAFT_1082502 [Amanita rubescens]|nr:hypothetical protein F5887DRAFT_1082502 [Amanita rubescens]